MAQRPSVQRCVQAAGPKLGFTLIEILIVGTLISLFAGLAIISIQQSYTSSTRKAMFDDTRSIGTAMAIARDDIGFFPRIYALGLPATMIENQDTGGVLPGMDAYGYLTGTERAAFILKNWAAPYTTVSEARRSFAQGTKLLVKMRLLEPNYPTTPPIGDRSLVDWPADIWGHPYVIYQVVSDPNAQNLTNNLLGLRLIQNTSEMPNYWTAIVSYGPNGVPGGNVDAEDKRPAAKTYRSSVLEPGSLVVRGDLKNSGAEFASNGQPIYSLKTYNSTVTGAGSLRDSTFTTAFPRTITSNSTDPDQIGIRDTGSDDVFWVF